MKWRAALIAFLLATWLVHALVAYWTPIQGDDWNHWIWAGQHQGNTTGTWLGVFLRTHFAFSDALGYLLARCRIAHVLLTPTAMVALVVGLFVLAVRRLPRATSDDLLGLGVVSMLIWIGQPFAGVTLFHIQNAALYLYGAAIAVWFVAPLRCDWQVSARWWPALILAGYCVGTSSRAIATATLVGVVIAMWRKPRVRWMWIAIASLVVGTIAGYLDPPWIEFGRVFRRGFEQNLIGRGLLKYVVAESGELISLVAMFALLDLVLGALGRTRAPSDARPDPRDGLRWLVAWFATAIWCLFGPKYNEAATLPATCLLVIGAVPYLVWLSRSRVLGSLLVAIVIAVHAIAWTMAITTYRDVGADGEARLAAFQHAKRGEAVAVPPYSTLKPTFWFVGEDFDTIRIRQLVAAEAFGLSDIKLEPAFRTMERNPGITLALETDGITDAQLNAARVPLWATDVSAARTQFDLFVKRLRKVAPGKFAARLVATNVTFDTAQGRRVFAAWVDETGSMIPRIARSPADAQSRHTIRVYGRDAREFKEAWMVVNGAATPIPYRFSSTSVQPMKIELNAVVLCDTERCLLADAFVPRF